MQGWRPALRGGRPKKFFESLISYILYDKIGRIIEVGELLSREEPQAYRHESQVQYSMVANGLEPNGTRVQITRTYYDRAAFSASESGLAQDNLRPRVASVTYQDRAEGGYERATHYSYDIHGNVESLVQHIREGDRDLRKRIDYDYDLVSGNVNRVYYQKGEADQFIHRYSYDGDNRITEVHTSRDGIIWTKEANYEYYAHGPLARTVLGDQSIETQDVAYTLQGWIKALNGQYFSYALGYFAGDYSSIGTTGNLATAVAEDKDLYNGNIATMASLNPKLSETVWTQQFSYDQLNRITGSKSVGLAHADAFRTSYSYDASGNILSLHRYNAQGQAFDALAYHYHNQQNGYRHNTNQLRWVDDNPALSANHEEDLEDQDTDNYHYDELGNLSRDVQEEIARIEWNVYGKVSRVIRTAESTKPDLEFLYDALGNRVAKIVKPKGGGAVYVYYIVDSDGNILSVYKKSETGFSAELEEQYIYGNSRIGMLSTGEAKNSRILGLRSYELTDHLGNVRTIISDRPTVLGFTDIVNACYEYFPGGMLMIEGVFNSGYRYGYQKQERDDEFLYSYDFKHRTHYSKINRFLSIDPLSSKFAYNSPYAFAENRLIDGKEIEGLEVVQIGVNTTFSLFVSGFTEAGILIAPDGIYGYSSYGYGLESNASAEQKLSVTFFPLMPSANDASGTGYSFGLSAGVGILGGGVSAVTSGDDPLVPNYEGINITFGYGLSVLPIAISGYKSETEIEKLLSFDKIQTYREPLMQARNVLQKQKSDIIEKKNGLVIQNKSLETANNILKNQVLANNNNPEVQKALNEQIIKNNAQISSNSKEIVSMKNIEQSINVAIEQIDQAL